MAIFLEASVSIGWLNDQVGFRADEAYYFDPEVRHARALQMMDYCGKRFPDYEINFFEANLVQTRFWRREQMNVGSIQPNMMVAVGFGSKFQIPGDRDPDIQPAPLKELDAEGLKRLREIDWRQVYPFKLFLEQIDAVRERHGPDCPIVPPFYWDTSGRAAIHGPITTAQKFMGERFYIEMIENPEFAHDFLDWITEGSISIARIFAERVGRPISGVHIGECSGCLLALEHFVDFSLPYCQRLIDALGPGKIHSCGLSDQLLDGFAKLQNLACVNSGSGTSVRRLRELFGKGMLLMMQPDAKLLTFGTPEEVRQFVDQTLEENDGGDLTFVYHLDLGYPLQNCLAMHERLIERGHIQRGRRHRPPAAVAAAP